MYRMPHPFSVLRGCLGWLTKGQNSGDRHLPGVGECELEQVLAAEGVGVMADLKRLSRL